MIRGKYGAVIGYKPQKYVYVPSLNFKKRLCSQPQRRISPWSSNHGIWPKMTDTVGWRRSALQSWQPIHVELEESIQTLW